MTSRASRWCLALAAVLGGLASSGGLGRAEVLSGGAYRLTGILVGGGGLSAEGPLRLTGVILPSASGRTAGDGYVVTGGVVAAPGETPGLRPRIRARLTEDKLAELTWDEDLIGLGYVLEFSPVLGPGENWQPASPQPTGTSFLTPCQQPARFFRFRRP